ncbi:GAK5 protein, partial [Sylvietta virens]|nr:GAK5 protein [Sylvietta virens]
ANDDCKCLLKALPPEPKPTLLQMIEACNRLGTLQHTTAVTYQAVRQGIAVAFAALKILPGKQMLCFGCGEPEHVKKDCQKVQNQKALGVRPRWQKGLHFANSCHSK